MSVMHHAEWVDRMREARAVDAALARGLQQIGRTASAWCFGPCPGCGAERRHTRSGDRRGALSSPKANPRGWRCWQCGATGDGIDLEAFTIFGKRYRDLNDSRRADVGVWCCTWLGLEHSARSTSTKAEPPRSKPPSTPPPVELAASFPPSTQLRAVWTDYAVRADADRDVSAYLSHRAIDPTACADSGIARALPRNVPLPNWARMGRDPWTRTGHRLLVLLYDHLGVARSVIARAIVDTERKSIAPRGHTRAGLVMADQLGRQLLRHGAHPSRWPMDGADDDAPGLDSPAGWWPTDQRLTVVIAEGEPDFLSWATEPCEAVVHPPAVFGVVQGAWSDAIAARIPDRSRVVLAQHHDPDGEKYALRVFESLRGRDIEVRRIRRRSSAP